MTPREKNSQKKKVKDSEKHQVLPALFNILDRFCPRFPYSSFKNRSPD